MAERDACLVISAATWYQMIDRTLPSELDALLEYKVRCRIVVAGSEVLMVHPYELAAGSSPFRQLDNDPELRKVPRFKVIREERWDREGG